MTTFARITSLAAAALVASTSAQAQRVTKDPSPASGPALKDVFKQDFMVGAALNERQFTEEDARGAAIVKAQYNTISPENVLKWEVVHPRPNVYNFVPSDRYVAFGQRNGMFVIGHTLVWHSQVPRWVFQDSAGNPLGRDALLARMREHIMTVAGRYKGRVRGWDVVNEALNEDGTLRDSPWRQIIGEDFIVKAFQYAHEADPAAELYYNDYSLENPAKRDGAVRLLKTLIAAGVRVKAIGMQEHQKMAWPTTALVDSAITMFAATGVHVNMTELDVDVLPPVTRSTGADVATRAQATEAANPYAAALPDSVQQALAQRYADLFQVYRKHRDVVDRVTFWGVADGDSWLNDWPARGRTSYPLPFDRQGNPKPAFTAIVRTAR